MCKYCRGHSKNKLTREDSQRVVITGDDILIEYISRLMHALKSIKTDKLKHRWTRGIEKFITHTVWHGSDSRRKDNNKIWQRVESRLIEMKERRRRMAAPNGSKRRGTSSERDYDVAEENKLSAIRGFSAQQLEEMLKNSSKNAAQDIIACLFEADGRGMLTEIIKWLATKASSKKRKSLFEYSDEEEAKGFRRTGRFR